MSCWSYAAFVDAVRGDLFERNIVYTQDIQMASLWYGIARGASGAPALRRICHMFHRRAAVACRFWEVGTVRHWLGVRRACYS